MKTEHAINQRDIQREFAALPPEAKRQVLDFMEFLKLRYANVPREGHFDFSGDPFIGMWREREDMMEGAEWVRNLRRSEWAMKGD